MSTNKKAVILFNSTGLNGLQKSDAISKLMQRCRQANYKVSRVFYYDDHNINTPLCKLIKMASRSYEKITVIFAKESEKSGSNLIIYSALSALSISGQIELCFYEPYINLQHVEPHEAHLMHKASTEYEQMLHNAGL